MRNLRDSHPTSQIHAGWTITFKTQHGAYGVRRLIWQARNGDAITGLFECYCGRFLAHQCDGKGLAFQSTHGEVGSGPAAQEQIEIVPARGKRSMMAPVTTMIAPLLQAVGKSVGPEDALAMMLKPCPDGLEYLGGRGRDRTIPARTDIQQQIAMIDRHGRQHIDHLPR